MRIRFGLLLAACLLAPAEAKPPAHVEVAHLEISQYILKGRDNGIFKNVDSCGNGDIILRHYVVDYPGNVKMRDWRKNYTGISPKDIFGDTDLTNGSFRGTINSN